MDFNEKLQELRKQNHLTQEELADALFVSRTAISKWESGRGYPNIDSLKAIAKYFSVSLDELLSGDEIITIAGQELNEKGFRADDIQIRDADTLLEVSETSKRAVILVAAWLGDARLIDNKMVELA